MTSPLAWSSAWLRARDEPARLRRTGTARMRGSFSASFCEPRPRVVGRRVVDDEQLPVARSSGGAPTRSPARRDRDRLRVGMTTETSSDSGTSTWRSHARDLRDRREPLEIVDARRRRRSTSSRRSIDFECARRAARATDRPRTAAIHASAPHVERAARVRRAARRAAAAVAAAAAAETIGPDAPAVRAVGREQIDARHPSIGGRLDPERRRERRRDVHRPRSRPDGGRARCPARPRAASPDRSWSPVRHCVYGAVTTPVAGDQTVSIGASRFHSTIRSPSGSPSTRS